MKALKDYYQDCQINLTHKMFLIDLFLSSHVSLMADAGQVQQQLDQSGSARRDLEESSKQIHSLEKQLKNLKQDRDDVQKVELFSFK